MQTLEFESQFEVCSLNEKDLKRLGSRKHYNLYEEYQDERSSMIPGVRRLHERERQLTSEISESQYREVSEKQKKTNNLEQSGTKLVVKYLARLTSYIHCASGHRQYCHVGNTAPQCTLGLCQDVDCAGNLAD